MRPDDFNEESEKPEFIYKKNPLVEHAYQIFQYDEDAADYQPIGEYTLLDLEEEPDVTAKRISNVIAVMNKKKRTIDFSNLTKTRILFNILPDRPDDKDQKVIFREHDGHGVSKENAIMVIRKGVFDDWIPRK